MHHLIFEESTSTLVTSNDGRLHVRRVLAGRPERVYVLYLDGVEVMATLDRTLADAYIAGYDLAQQPVPAR